MHSVSEQSQHLLFHLRSWKMDCTFFSSVELVIVAAWQQAKICSSFFFLIDYILKHQKMLKIRTSNYQNTNMTVQKMWIIQPHLHLYSNCGVECYIVINEVRYLNMTNQTQSKDMSYDFIESNFSWMTENNVHQVVRIRRTNSPWV